MFFECALFILLVRTEADGKLGSAERSDLARETKFVLYTRNGPREGYVLEQTSENLRGSTFDPKRPTKFVTHGFLSNGGSDTCIEIKDAYLQTADVNVVVLDWKDIAGNINYLVTSRKTKEIGQYYAEYIDFLVDNGFDPTDFHLIGHSLGAHLSGFAGQDAKVKVGRITGLDPAFPSFGSLQLAGGRLGRGSAHFVDVIHTSAGTFGLREPIGDVDFYPNNGTALQPGCNIFDDMTASCSHGRSWIYFKYSIYPNIYFPSFRCSNMEVVAKGDCFNDSVLMGEPVPHTASGIYFLQTSTKPPYGIEVHN